MTIDILLNVLRSEGNQTMKFSKLIKYSGKNVFIQKSWRKEGRETISRTLLVFKKNYKK